MTGMAEIRAEHDPQEDVAPDFDEETENYLREIAPDWIACPDAGGIRCYGDYCVRTGECEEQRPSDG